MKRVIEIHVKALVYKIDVPDSNVALFVRRMMLNNVELGPDGKGGSWAKWLNDNNLDFHIEYSK